MCHKFGGWTSKPPSCFDVNSRGFHGFTGLNPAISAVQLRSGSESAHQRVQWRLAHANRPGAISFCMESQSLLGYGRDIYIGYYWIILGFNVKCGMVVGIQLTNIIWFLGSAIRGFDMNMMRNNWMEWCTIFSVNPHPTVIWGVGSMQNCIQDLGELCILDFTTTANLKILQDS
jgi:hypothetical protein